jgi:hypothetical protein
MIVKLSQPTQVNGSELTEINLELEKLKGKELLELIAGYKRYNRGDYIPVPYLEPGFQCFVAGRACGINPEDLGELSAPDLVEVCSAVQNFLLGSGSRPAETAKAVSKIPSSVPS